VTSPSILIAIVALSAAQEWPTHDGDLGAAKYSRLTDINRENVSRLELAWTWEAREEPIAASATTFPGRALAPGKFQGTPVLVGDTLYITTSFTQVAALDAETGAEKWRYDPRAYDIVGSRSGPMAGTSASSSTPVGDSSPSTAARASPSRRSESAVKST
jgi:glucose dehydrogenase